MTSQKRLRRRPARSATGREMRVLNACIKRVRVLIRVLNCRFKMRPFFEQMQTKLPSETGFSCRTFGNVEFKNVMNRVSKGKHEFPTMTKQAKF